MIIYFIGLAITYMVVLVYYFAIPLTPYIILINMLFAASRKRPVAVTTVQGTVLFLFGIYPWIAMLIRLFHKKLPNFVSNMAYYAANISSLMMCFFIWINLEKYRPGTFIYTVSESDPDLVDNPFIVMLILITPFVLLAAVSVTLLPRIYKCMKRINAGASWVEPERHECEWFFCINCSTPFALLTFWAAPAAVLQRLRESDSSLFYTPFDISKDLPAYYNEYSYMLSAVATIVWMAVVFYPRIRRGMKRLNWLQVRRTTESD